MSNVQLRDIPRGSTRGRSMWDDASPHLFEPYAARKARLAAERSAADTEARLTTSERARLRADVVKRIEIGETPGDIAAALGVKRSVIKTMAYRAGYRRVDTSARNAAILADVAKGWRYRDVAEAYGVSKNTVCSLVFRAKGRRP